MLCTCSKCTASGCTDFRLRDDYMPAPHEISTAEERNARLMAVLKSIDASMPKPRSYAAALADYERRSKQTLAEWLEENMRCV